MPGMFGLQTRDIMAAYLCPDGDRRDLAGRGTLECKCSGVKKGAG